MRCAKNKCVCFKGALSGVRQFLANESPSKMMKNAFYFTIKTLFVLKVFKFLSWLGLVIYKNGLIRKARLISKFMTSQTGSQTIVIHMLPNIARSKGNQTIKFDQLIGRNYSQTLF